MDITVFVHGVLVVVGYIFAGFVGLIYLNAGIMLYLASCDLKYVIAPKHEYHDLHPLYWEELEPNEQAIAMKRLPLGIVLCVLAWLAYLAFGYFVVIRIFLPGIVAFFSNIH
ncbi:hypothetical protein IJG98_00980 [Candidatus Saccharibacteria bacterium]|nr:hypothetical protein [Candidatus Saccharibacteria bacterium]